MATNNKTPPLMKEDSNYELWKKEIKLWKTFTDLDAKKQGPAISLPLTGKAREATLELSEPVLAYRVLISANISPEKEQLAPATVTELKYEAMKKQVLRIFDETCLTKNSSPPVNVEVEDAFYSNSLRGCSFYRRRGRGGRGEAPESRYANQSVPQSKGEQPQNRVVEVKNPLDANGFVTKCMVYKSIYHWAKDCLDQNAMYAASQEEEVRITLLSKPVQECM